MLQYPAIDPVLLDLPGPLAIRWYGLMYLIGFAAAWWLANRQAARPGSNWSTEQINDLLFFGFIGVILGGRIGSSLFYHFDQFLANPLSLFKIWQGGMSFHGGLLGVIVAMIWFARREQKSFWQVTDFLAPLVPIGLGLGRIGNFINGELWGRVSDVPWAMVFPGGGALPRHPSQLYQAGLEGFALFILLWWFARRPRPTGAISGLFLVGYGCARFIVEFFREPDAHLGLLSGSLSMGQWLSLPMILAGGAIIWLALGSQLFTPGGRAPTTGKKSAGKSNTKSGNTKSGKKARRS